MIVTFWHMFALIAVALFGVTATLYALVSSSNAYENTKSPPWPGRTLLVVAMALGAATFAGFFTLLDGWFL